MWATVQTAAADRQTLPIDWGSFGRYLNGLEHQSPEERL